MKNIVLAILSSAGIALSTFAQSDNCSSATSISVNASCTPINGTSTGATQTISGCSGNADDDVWYQFVATASSHQIIVTGSASYDPVVQIFSGSCASLVSLVCKDDFGSGVTETANVSGLSIGSTYKMRIYHYGSGSGSGTFTVCVTNPPVAPSNDACAGSTLLTVNTTCTYTNGTTDGATQSVAGCSGTADDDVWYRFVATNSVQNIAVHPTEPIDVVVQVYSGTCGSMTSIMCQDNTFASQDEQFDVVGLIAGQTYYVRVFDYYSGNSGNFQICVSGSATAAPTNDEACSAIQLPTVTSTCFYSEFTTVGATASISAPTPSNCAGGSGAQQGGFGASTKDVWFKITVPSTGNIHITSKPNMGAGAITDGVMALYSGTCSSLTQIACSDDHTLYPGSANDMLPLLSASGLTPGATVYLRYFGYGTSQGNFGICVTTATNDNCANALYICDINGYSASTSGAYTPDRPGNMHGNNEDNAGVNMVDGTNTGGIFGQGGPWGAGAPAFDVTINNNSWIKFTAASTSATLQVSIYDCWVGNYPSGGIQMQVFEGNNCSSFVPVSDFKENSSGFTITANNLTIGNVYYLMVDGFAGDICNYTITAQSGVQFPDIAEVAPICAGASVTLSAPVGATSYSWQHNGATTQTVNVTPSTTQTYYCEVSGLCGYKQMLDVLVTVNPLPAVSITNGSSISICSGESAILTANGATSYSWNTGSTSATTTVAPLSLTNYSVTGTSNGCTATDNINVVVNSNPTLSAIPTSTDSDCGGSTGALNGATGSGAAPLSYSWTNGIGTVIGTTQNISNIPAGVYYLEITDGNTCSTQFGPYNVINPGAPSSPSITVDDASPCLSSNTQLTATLPGATFTWSGPNSFNSTSSVINLTNVDPTDQGNYCVTATIAGCTGPSACQSIVVMSPPPVQITANGNDSTICTNEDFILNASGASSYSWTGPNSFTNNTSSATISEVDPTDQGFYVVTGTDANNCINTDSIYISILPLPLLSLNTNSVNDTYCLNTVIGLSATGAQSYSWTGPDNFTSTNQNPTILNASAVNDGWYVVTATDSESCTNIDSVRVMIVTSIPVAAAVSDSIICPDESVILSGTGGVSYSWTGPESFTSTNQTMTLTSMTTSQSGWYYVTVTDANGCQGNDSTHILVETSSDCLFIPDLVTPDQDGLNDNWSIQGLEKYENAVVEVYNRWGNLVYYTSPYTAPWDGTVNRGLTIDGKGQTVPVGTYFYIINLNEDDKPPFKGFVEVQF